MDNNPYSKLLLICDAAEQFIAASKESGIDTSTLLRILDCLLSIEDVLDKGRSVAYPGASSEFGADKQAVNERMDAVRSEIFSLMQKIGKVEVIDLLETRARQNRARSVAANI